MGCSVVIFGFIPIFFLRSLYTGERQGPFGPLFRRATSQLSCLSCIITRGRQADIFLFVFYVSCEQRMLTPPYTWSCPSFRLPCHLTSKTIFPKLVLFPDFWVSNTLFISILLCNNYIPSFTEHSFSLFRSFWLIWVMLFKSSVSADTPRGVSSRFLSNVWALFALVFLASYTANLATFMIRKDTYWNLSGLSDWRVSTCIKFS